MKMTITCGDSLIKVPFNGKEDKDFAMEFFRLFLNNAHPDKAFTCAFERESGSTDFYHTPSENPEETLTPVKDNSDGAEA